jgi:hypothetical protein
LCHYLDIIGIWLVLYTSILYGEKYFKTAIILSIRPLATSSILN